MPKSEIYFDLNESNKHLNVTIETERLHMESVTPSYFMDNSYPSLFSDSEIMAKFGTGQHWTSETTKLRVDTWVKRWHSNDPYSAFAVSKSDDDSFIGHVVLGYGEAPGSAELVYAFNKHYWGKGYGKESVTTVVKEYVPELVKRDYKVGGKHQLSAITATARTDNEASIKILKTVGLEVTHQELSYGHNRHVFFADVKKLMQQSSNDMQPIGEINANLVKLNR